MLIEVTKEIENFKELKPFNFYLKIAPLSGIIYLYLGSDDTFYYFYYIVKLQNMLTLEQLQEIINEIFNNPCDQIRITELEPNAESFRVFRVTFNEIKQPKVKLPDIPKWYMKSRLIDRSLPSIDMD